MSPIRSSDRTMSSNVRHIISTLSQISAIDYPCSTRGHSSSHSTSRYPCTNLLWHTCRTPLSTAHCHGCSSRTLSIRSRARRTSAHVAFPGIATPVTLAHPLPHPQSSTALRHRPRRRRHLHLPRYRPRRSVRLPLLLLRPRPRQRCRQRDSRPRPRPQRAPRPQRIG